MVQPAVLAFVVVNMVVVVNPSSERKEPMKNKQTHVRKLEQERQYLQKIIRYAEGKIAKAPPGSVQVKRHSNGAQFFYRTEPSQKNGVYIPASERKLAIDLVQKRYLEQVLKAAEKQLKAMDRFLSVYDANAIRQVYTKEGFLRQNYLEPIELPDEEFRTAWQEQHYEGKEILEGVPEHYTRKGERVRSKSEVLIADALYGLGIPYRYECPLKLRQRVIHPDFTILRMSDRKELYWEHLGMMDDTEYRNHAMQRIQEYEANGIYPGEDLIVSAETMRFPLNRKIVEGMIRRYILEH